MVKSFIALVSILLTVNGCAMRPTPEEITNANYGPFPTNYEKITKDYFAKSLFDPYSSAFTFEEPVKGWTNGGRNRFGWIVCGTYNAKNRIGGYVGIKDYYVKIWHDNVEDMLYGPMATDICHVLKKRAHSR